MRAQAGGIIALRFERESGIIAQNYGTQLHRYDAMLRAGQAMMASFDSMSPEHWRRLARHLNLDSPDLQVDVFAAVQPVEADDVARMEQEQRRIWGEDFSVRRGTAGGTGLFVTQVAPMPGARSLPGLDIAGVPALKEAADQARDSGKAVFVAHMSLLPVRLKKNSLIQIAPVYQAGWPVTTVANRQAAVKGFVLMEADLALVFGPGLNDLAEGSAVRMAVTGPGSNVETVIFQSPSWGEGDPALHSATVLPSSLGRLHVDVSRPTTVSSVEDSHLIRAPEAVLAGGSVASFLLGLTTWLLLTSQARAHAVARSMTEAFHEAETRYRQLFVGIRVPEMLIDATTGDIVEANDAAAQFYGWQTSKLATLNIADLTVDQAQRGSVLDEMRQALVSPRDSYGFVHRLADGTQRDVDVHLGPLDGGGRLLLYAVVLDVSGRRQAEQAVAASELRFRTLFEQSPLAMQVVDADGLTVRVNRAWEVLWRKSSAAVIREAQSIYSDSQLADANIATFQKRAVDQGQGLEIPAFRYVFAGPKPYERFLRTFVCPIGDPSGKPLETMLIFDDVSERHRQELRLAQTLKDLGRSNQELERFAYVTSHDLQEPLRMVTSYLSLLNKRYHDQLDDDAREFIGFAVDGAHNMQELINDLLTYSRVGHAMQNDDPVSIEDCFKRALISLAPVINQAHALVLHEALPVLPCNPTEMERLFQNLVGNAIKYSRPGVAPRVDVRAEQIGGGVWRFTVTDNGLGIAPEHQERIFQIFQRLHTRADFPGSGIGLAICRKIIDAHGGRIGVESRVGEGAVFWFTLPSSQTALAARPVD